VNRKQLLVVALVVGLLLIGWMVGEQGYGLHRQLTMSFELDPKSDVDPDPSARPEARVVDATMSCPAPLSTPDARLHVTSPGLALSGVEGWRPVYAPNPCVTTAAARRHVLELEAAAVLLVGLVGLFAFRPRTPASPSPQAAGNRRAA
jgi:hypothetical protein